MEITKRASRYFLRSIVVAFTKSWLWRGITKADWKFHPNSSPRIKPGESSQLITSSFELALAATILEALAERRTIPSCCCTSDDPKAALDESRLAGVATADPGSVIIVAAIVNTEVGLKDCFTNLPHSTNRLHAEVLSCQVAK